MKSLVTVCTLLLVIFNCSSALKVTQCSGNAKSIENLEDKVKIGGCVKPPCRLRKNSNIAVELKFKPEKDTPKVLNTVSANIVGVPFPFPGVDQTDACNSIYKADGITKNGCPLKANEDYIYRNSIEVLQIYPKISTVVHWALTGPQGDLICFEVPARITN